MNIVPVPLRRPAAIVGLSLLLLQIVAIIFAANQNDVIGWLVVAVAAVDVIVCTSAERLFLAYC